MKFLSLNNVQKNGSAIAEFIYSTTMPRVFVHKIYRNGIQCETFSCPVATFVVAK